MKKPTVIVGGPFQMTAETEFICKHCGFPTQPRLAKNWFKCQELVTDEYLESIFRSWMKKNEKYERARSLNLSITRLHDTFFHKSIILLHFIDRHE